MAAQICEENSDGRVDWAVLPLEFKGKKIFLLWDSEARRKEWKCELWMAHSWCWSESSFFFFIMASLLALIFFICE